MKSLIQAAVIIALCALVTSPALAQPPRGQRGAGGPGGQRSGGPPHRGHDGGAAEKAIMRALDTDRDHEISADEISNAAVALRELDVDGDGKLTEADERSVNGAQRPRRSRAQVLRGSGAQSPRGGGAKPPRISGRETTEQRYREPNGRGGQRHRPGSIEEGAGGPPSSDQFVQHALEFDADEDGQLDAEELKAFAEQMGPPQHGPGHGGRDEPRDRADRPERDRPQRPDLPAR